MSWKPYATQKQMPAMTWMVFQPNQSNKSNKHQKTKLRLSQKSSLGLAHTNEKVKPIYQAPSGRVPNVFVFVLKSFQKTLQLEGAATWSSPKDAKHSDEPSLAPRFGGLRVPHGTDLGAFLQRGTPQQRGRKRKADGRDGKTWVILVLYRGPYWTPRNLEFRILDL